MLVEQVGSKIEMIKENLAGGPGEKKKKALEANLEKAEAREKMLKGLACSFDNPLKNESHIFPLRKEVQALNAVEEAAKGRLMTLKETEQMGKKMEICAKIETLERNSRDWFEADDEFQKRTDASRKKVRVGKGGGTGG